MPNFLLGKGENLFEDTEVRRGGGPKKVPYSVRQAKIRVRRMLQSMCKNLRELPDDACPRDEAVVSLILHPEYVAKSYFPNTLLRRANLIYVGSVPTVVSPEKRSNSRPPVTLETTELYARGQRENLYRLEEQIADWDTHSKYTRELISVEQIYLRSAEKKIRSKFDTASQVIVEVVLHANELDSQHYVLSAFTDYLNGNNVEFEITHRFYIQQLTYLVLKTIETSIKTIANFATVRVLRRLANLRSIRPMLREVQSAEHSVVLPKHGCVSNAVSVAVLDAGLPAKHHLQPWVVYVDEVSNGTRPDSDFARHGMAVTSATLFGHIRPDNVLQQPFTKVKHFRVVDVSDEKDGLALPIVLTRIRDLLSRNEFDFVNLSLGPNEPILDDEISLWTAGIDDCLSRNGSLMTVAVGNNGFGDAALGFNRIQVPSDCVNALGIGACDSATIIWNRASYSAIGPGRRPGWVKPDLVSFGGTDAEPFLYIGEGSQPLLFPTQGTSFSAPGVLNIASGLRACFPELGNLAIVALLINTAEPHSDATLPEIGWGRVCGSLDRIMICQNEEVRVLFQGEVSPAKWIRAPIPIPQEVDTGKVRIVATLYFKSQIDVNSPSNYTESGIEVVFRPHDQRFREKSDSEHAKSDAFFGNPASPQPESNLRRDAFKWENCLHSSKTKFAKSLRNPCFDIHYMTRSEGRPSSSENVLRFALVVRIHAPSIQNLYDLVLQNYQGVLEQLTPVVEVPIAIST